MSQGEGTWQARHQEPITDKRVYRSLGTILDDKPYDVAAKLAIEWSNTIEQGVSHKDATVEEVCRAYVLRQKSEKSETSSKDAEGRFKRLVYDKPFGRIKLSKLRTSDVRKWRDEQTRVDDASATDDELRKSKDSANRNLATLKAALNLAFKDRLVATDAGWKTAEKFEDVGSRRTACLDSSQRDALIKSCSDDLAPFAKAMLLTAARPGELARLTVQDFNKSQGTIEFNRTVKGKTGHRIVPLPSKCIKLFTELSKNKLPAALLLPRLENGIPEQWNKDSWKKAFSTAAKAAGLPAGAVMYTLRHTAITNLITGGMDSTQVAQMSGTSIEMITKHYGHLRNKEARELMDKINLI